VGHAHAAEVRDDGEGGPHGVVDVAGEDDDAGHDLLTPADLVQGEAGDGGRHLGRLDDAAKTTLVETLQQTAQEDWPVVVAAFAESLEASAAATSEADAVASLLPARPYRWLQWLGGLGPLLTSTPHPSQLVLERLLKAL
jgi:hypothetical protein